MKGEQKGEESGIGGKEMDLLKTESLSLETRGQLEGCS
jgi:hypothetical protein